LAAASKSTLGDEASRSSNVERRREMGAAEQDMIYAAARATFGLVVRGDAKRLRAARTALVQCDASLVDLAVLGPDRSGQVWLVRKDALRRHLLGDASAQGS
jgi:hypothetical protein